ncbi:MAG: hypothetical protein IT483_00470 [Gammaproteobacteria bacterium]|nr:hypothetical protein [Gammaproteobacteria bacterium]
MKLLNAALLTCCLVADLAHAHPDEAWVARARLPAGASPLLAFVVDTSSSMQQVLRARPPYEPSVDYGATLGAGPRCDPGRVYWRRGPGQRPDCAGDASVAASFAGQRGLACHAAQAALAQYGVYVAGRAAQWEARPGGGWWRAPAEGSDAAIECSADRDAYAAHGSAGPWSSDPALQIDWQSAPLGDPYVFYAGNFLNYLAAVQPDLDLPAIELVRRGLRALPSIAGELDFTLLTTTGNADDRLAIAAATLEASGTAPLGETLAQSAGRIAAQYESTSTHACRPATLALATAGRPSGDEGAEAAVAALEIPGLDVPGCSGSCATWLLARLPDVDLVAAKPGEQRIGTWVLAATADAQAIATSAARPTLELDDPLAFATLAAHALAADAAVAAPQTHSAVSIVTESAAESAGLVGLTVPALAPRWRGNLKKFRVTPAAVSASPLAPPLLVDRNDQPVLDPASGEWSHDALDLWATSPAGSAPLDGGAAGLLEEPAVRRLYTHRGPADLTDPANLVDAEHPLRHLEGLGAPGPGAPVIVAYAPDGPRVAFTVTAGGLLQAFDADAGRELWAFAPPSLLAGAEGAGPAWPTPNREPGPAGDVRAHLHDANADGRITPNSGDHAWLAWGLGRGGRGYLALDVSDVERPRLLWSLGTTGLPELGLATAAPVYARLDVRGGTQNAGRWVVALAAGSDPAGDSARLSAANTGRALYLVDAESGALLWSAGAAADADLPLPALHQSLPAAPRLLDLNGDGWLDRLYVVDAAGSLWRVDFASGSSRAALATGGRLADLGATEQRFAVEPDAAWAHAVDGRRYLAVSFGSGWLVQPREDTIADRFYSLRDFHGAALTAEAWSSLRALRDTDLSDVTDAVDPLSGAATTASADGWYVRLEGSGEKTAGRALTLAGTVHVPTWRPLPSLPAEPCGPPRGRARLRAFDLVSGRAVVRVIEADADGEEDVASERESDFGLPPAPVVALPPAAAACAGSQCRRGPWLLWGLEALPPGFSADPVRTTWRERDPSALR